MRTSSMVAALGAAVLLAACKPKVPQEWQDVVPTEALSKAYPSQGNATLGDPPGVMCFYKRKKIDSAKLRANFQAKITGAGYEHVFECSGRPDRAGDGFAKAPKSFIDFSSGPLTADTWDVRLRRSDALRRVGLPTVGDCKWLPAAAKFCGGMPSGDTCVFPE